jgi:hypothetical protein
MWKKYSLFLFFITAVIPLQTQSFVVKNTSSSKQWSFSHPLADQLHPSTADAVLPGLPEVKIFLPFAATTADFSIDYTDKFYLPDAYTLPQVPDPSVVYAGSFRGQKVYILSFSPLGRDKNGTFVALHGTVTYKAASKNLQMYSDPAFTHVFGSEVVFATPGDRITRQKQIETNKRSAIGKVKIYTESAGLFRLTGADLRATEIDFSGVDPRELKLYNEGQEIPLLVIGESDGILDDEDYLEFFAAEKRFNLDERFSAAQNSDQYYDPFTSYNTYWLDWSPGLGLRMVDESGEIRSIDPADYLANNFFVETIHFEENNLIDALGTMDINQLSFIRDHTFFDSGISRGSKRDYTFRLTAPLIVSGLYDQEVGVRIWLTGLTTVPGWDHQVSIFLNNRLIVQPFSGWQGQNRILLERFTEVTSDVFENGVNSLEISVPDLGETDEIVLNAFEVSYIRAYTAADDQLAFQLSPETKAQFAGTKRLVQFSIDGFSNPDIRIYKNGVSRIQNFIKEGYVSEEGQRLFRVVFQDNFSNPDVNYYAVAGEQRSRPSRIEAEIPTLIDGAEKSLWDTDNSAEILVLSHRLFENFAQQYASNRAASTGLLTKLVYVDDIYDEFNYGAKSPIAIKDFIAHVYYNWQQSAKLQYVILLGDADYRYWDDINNPTDFIPTFLFQTYKRGASASDHEYSLLEGEDIFAYPDAFSDIFVGRIPVKTNAELQAYLNKIQEYEDPLVRSQAWTSRSLLIAGDDAAAFEPFASREPAFRAQNNRVARAQTPGTMAVDRIHTVRNTDLPEDLDYGNSITLRNKIDAGVNFINFLGHGGGGRWADVNLMSNADVDRLANAGMYPFVASMTCFTGQYESNRTIGMMEKMVIAENKGAIASFASSGLGWLQNDFAILWDLVPQLMQNGMPFGPAMVLNKAYYFTFHRYYGDSYYYPAASFGLVGKSMVHQYNLIGDPTLRLPNPSTAINVRLAENTFAEGLNLRLVFADDYWNGQSGYYRVTDSERRPLYERSLTLSEADTLQLDFAGPFADQSGFVYVYLENSDKQENGAVNLPFAIDDVLVDSIMTYPEKPATGDEIILSWMFAPLKTIDRVVFQNDVSSEIELVNTGANTYQLPRILGPFSRREYIVYSLHFYFADGSEKRIGGFTLEVENNNPDIAVESYNTAFAGGAAIGLNFTLRNNGLADADSFHVAIFNGETQFALLKTDLRGREQRKFSIPFPFSMADDPHVLRIEADHFNELQEPDKSNNIYIETLASNRFYLNNAVGSSYSGDKNDTITYLQAAKIVASGNYNGASGTVFIDSAHTEIVAEGFTRVPFAGGGNTWNILLEKEVDDQSLDSLKIWAYWDKEYLSRKGFDPATLSLYLYSPRFNQWVRAESADLNTDLGRAAFSMTGYSGFAFLVGFDAELPFVDVTVDGYSLNREVDDRKPVFVSRQPKLSFILQDNQGINLTSERFLIELDGQPVQEEDLLFSGSVENANSIGLTYYPVFSPGEHELLVQVEDINGNVSRNDYQFMVESEFRFRVIGAFPNPFTSLHDKCFIQFEVNQPVLPQDFKATLYTLGGRKIREFKGEEEFDTQLLNVKYFEWDGRDKDGNEVANGVYFMRIEMKSSDTGTTKHETLKIAKLR